MKVTLLDKLTLEKDRRDFDHSLVPASRIKYFKFLNKKYSSEMMKTNLWFLLFMIPVFFGVFFAPALFKGMAMEGKSMNFMANIGIGYPGVSDSLVALKTAILTNYFWVVLILAGSILFLGLGAAGVFYNCRNLDWGVPIKPTKSFFKGIKLFGLKFLLVFFFIALIFAGDGILFLWHRINMVNSTNLVWSWIAIIAASGISLYLMVVLIHLLPMIMAYKFKAKDMLKNSFILSISFFPVAVFIAIFTIIPFVLATLNSFLAFLVYMLIIMFGGSFLGLMWTCYGHYAFDCSINPMYDAQFEPKGKKKKKGKQTNTNNNPQVINMDNQDREQTANSNTNNNKINNQNKNKSNNNNKQNKNKKKK